MCRWGASQVATTKHVGQLLMLSVPRVDHAIVDFFSDLLLLLSKRLDAAWPKLVRIQGVPAAYGTSNLS